MYEDIFTQIRNEAEKRNLKENTINADAPPENNNDKQQEENKSWLVRFLMNV